MTENGPFTFALPLDDLSDYEVTVISQPPTSPPQFCPVENGQGSLSGASIENVVVTCVQGAELIYEDGFEDLDPE